MSMTKLAVQFVDREVQRLFSQSPPVRRNFCENPVTGGWYVGGHDRVGKQMDDAHRALDVRQWHAATGPADVQPLPISPCERDAMERKGTPLHYIFAKFARSVEHYYLKPGLDVSEHPIFAEYAAGYLWETGLPAGGFAYLPSYPAEQVDELKKRFPPKMLKGMSPGATWLPPKEHREAIDSLRRCSPSSDVYFYRE
jgi:hypothetical protein